MNEQENNELEVLIKRIFLQNRTKPEISSKERLSTIIHRCLHELALRDFLVLSSHLILAMLTLLTLYSKLILPKPQRTKP